MPEAYGFSDKDSNRIVDVVKRVEGSPLFSPNSANQKGSNRTNYRRFKLRENLTNRGPAEARYQYFTVDDEGNGTWHDDDLIVDIYAGEDQVTDEEDEEVILETNEIVWCVWAYGEWFAIIQGGESDCTERNEIQRIILVGTPTGGTFTIGQQVLNHYENITIEYDMTATEIKAAMVATHPSFTEDNILVTGGPLPYGVIDIQYVDNLAKKRIPVMGADWNNLQGAGLGIIPIRIQEGFPGDARIS